MRMMRQLGWAALALGLALLWPALARASLLTASYYSVPNNNAQDPDFQGAVTGLVQGEVQSQLGPDGLPVVTSLGAQNIKMVNSQGEILWWTPSTTYGIQFVGQANTSLPINDPYMYVSNVPNNFSNSNANDNTQFLTAHFQGTFSTTLSGTYSLNSDSDDDTWVFIDGILVVDNGGVHGATDVITNFTLSAGAHTIDIFYADQHTTGAVFDLNSFTGPDGNPVNLNPVAPEPASLTMLGLGALGLMGYGWRRKRKAARVPVAAG
jgi:fibro-slime domain-containing protein